MRAVAITAPPGTGVAPPDKPVPAPRPTTGMPSAARMRIAREHSSVVRGSSTISGCSWISARPSDSYATRPAGVSTTLRGPRTLLNSARAAADRGMDGVYGCTEPGGIPRSARGRRRRRRRLELGGIEPGSVLLEVDPGEPPPRQGEQHGDEGERRCEREPEVVLQRS